MQPDSTWMSDFVHCRALPYSFLQSGRDLCFRNATWSSNCCHVAVLVVARVSVVGMSSVVSKLKV